MLSTETISNNLSSERDFHNKRFEDGDNRQVQDKYYWAVQNGARKYWSKVREYSEGSSVLAYGCGLGQGFDELTSLCESLDAIDISDVAIDAAREKFGSPRANFHVMDAMNLTFPSESFDLVFGSGIIHHLDVERSCAEIKRVLKPGGKAVFWEPLGTNPVINLYRYFTPNVRTPDEHPLMPHDLATMRKGLSGIEVECYGLTTLCSVPFYKSNSGQKLRQLLEKVDRSILNVPGVRLAAWYTLITMKK